MKIYQNYQNWLIEDDLDPDLVKEISNIFEKNKVDLLNLEDKKTFSPKGQNIEQYWLVKPTSDFHIKDTKFVEFEKKYKNEIISRLKKSEVLNQHFEDNLSLKMANCWSVVGEENSFHCVHSHNGINKGIATVLYLKIPDTNEADKKENNIFLILNSNANPSPFIYYNPPGHIDINPEVGKLLIFPDWILHGSYPQTKGVRQTLNLDYQFLFE